MLRNYNPQLSFDEIRSHWEEEVRIDWHGLIALGDPATGRYLAQEFLRIPDSGTYEIVMQWRSAQLIRELGSVLEREEEAYLTNKLLPGNDSFMNREPSSSAELAHRIVQNIHDGWTYLGGAKSAVPFYPELPPATRESLKLFYREWDQAQSAALGRRTEDESFPFGDAMTEYYTGIRSTMKAWWLANKEAFLAEKYAEVKPLDERTTIRPPKATEEKPKSSATPAPKSPQPSPVAKHGQESPGNWWPWLAGGAAFLAALIFWLRRRRA